MFTNNEIKEILEKTRSYKETSTITGLSISALTSRNARKWHICIRIWNEQNTKYLVDNFANHTDDWLSEKLNMTKIQIQSKARALKLKKDKSHINKIQLNNSKNIASGPHRHSGPSKNMIYKHGSDHHNWVHDRSKIKGHRRKQFRFLTKTKREVLTLQNYRCNLCNKILNKIEYDHIQPVVIGGTSDINNCQALCPTCHFDKTRLEQKMSNNFKNLDSLKKIYEQYNFIARNLV